MYENTNSTNLYNPFGGSVNIIWANKNSSGDRKAFRIGVFGIPQEACVELATQDWGGSSSS